MSSRISPVLSVLTPFMFLIRNLALMVSLLVGRAASVAHGRSSYFPGFFDGIVEPAFLLVSGQWQSRGSQVMTRGLASRMSGLSRRMSRNRRSVGFRLVVC